MKRTVVFLLVLVMLALGCASGELAFKADKPLPMATVGQQYSYSFSSPDNPRGGEPPYSFLIGTAGGFPPIGLHLDASGTLSGTPAAAGTYEFDVCVKDLAGNQSCQRVSLTVEPMPEQEAEGATTTPSSEPDRTTVTLDSISYHLVETTSSSVTNSQMYFYEISLGGTVSGSVGSQLTLYADSTGWVGSFPRDELGDPYYGNGHISKLEVTGWTTVSAERADRTEGSPAPATWQATTYMRCEVITNGLLARDDFALGRNTVEFVVSVWSPGPPTERATTSESLTITR